MENVLDILNIIDNPELFSLYFLKILNKDQKLVLFEWNDLQRDFYSNMTGKDIILKSRQIGFSTLIQALIFKDLITKPTSALVLGNNQQTVDKLRLIQDRYYENFPKIKEFSKPVRKYSNATLTTYPSINSQLTIATAGNKEVGRGGTYSFIHGSEVAFWTNPEEILSGAMQGGNPRIVLESTPNGATGWFYELCMASLKGENDWKLHFYPYHLFPEYQQEGWEETKRKELGRFFDQEYPSNIESCFLTSGNGYFSNLEISFESTNNQFITSHIYSAGIDFGQSNDFTVMTVIDRTDNKQVDFLHLNKMSWNLQRLEIIKMYRKWNLQSVRAEVNSIGSVNIEELENSGLVVERFTTTNQSKNLIMQQLYTALENGLQLLDNPIQKMELLSIQSKQTQTGLWTISAPNGLHDDFVISLALAVSAKTKSAEKKARSWV